MHIFKLHRHVPGRSIITKKGDGSQVKESTDSSTTLEDDDVKGKNFYIIVSYLNLCEHWSLSHFHNFLTFFFEISPNLSSTNEGEFLEKGGSYR